MASEAMAGLGRATGALFAYIALSWLLLLLAPRYAVDSSVDLSEAEAVASWSTIGSAEQVAGGAGLPALQVPAGADGALERRVAVPDRDVLLVQAELRVPALSPEEPPWDGARLLLLAEVPGDSLDLGRPFRVFEAGEAVPEASGQLAVHPRPDDVSYRLQAQVMGGGRLELLDLKLTAVDYSPLWRGFQLGGRMLGYALLCWLFIPDLRRCRHSLSAAPVVLSVVAILFGCTVPAALKAEIYGHLGPVFALLPWGFGEQPESPVTVVPPKSWFATLHFVFFAAAGAAMVVSRDATPAGARVLQIVLLAAVTETMQGWIPDRGPGFEDVAVDLMGAAAGSVLGLGLLRLAQRKGLFPE